MYQATFLKASFIIIMHNETVVKINPPSSLESFNGQHIFRLFSFSSFYMIPTYMLSQLQKDSICLYRSTSKYNLWWPHPNRLVSLLCFTITTIAHQQNPCSIPAHRTHRRVPNAQNWMERTAAIQVLYFIFSNLSFGRDIALGEKCTFRIIYFFKERKEEKQSQTLHISATRDGAHPTLKMIVAQANLIAGTASNARL